MPHCSTRGAECPGTQPWAASFERSTERSTEGSTKTRRADISCGWTGVVVALFLGGLAALVPTIIAILIAALALSIWKGALPVRPWQITCCVLAVGAALFGAELVLANTSFHDPAACQFYV